MPLEPRYQVTGPRIGQYHVIDTRCDFRAGPYSQQERAQGVADLLNEGHEKNQREMKGIIARIKELITS